MANFESPKCADCDFGKGYFRPHKRNTINNNPMNYQDLKKHHLLPRQMMSSDKDISQDPGTIYHIRCNADPYEMISGGYVFVDYANVFKASYIK